MTAEQSTVQDWLRLIQAEYLEMPGLRLTKPQVQQLWRLEPEMCDALLESLVATDFLKKTHRNAYVLSQTFVQARVAQSGQTACTRENPARLR
jgi:hypothetical protein